MDDDNFRIEEGSGNVFANLGLPDAEKRLTNANFAMQLSDAVRNRKLNQAKAAALLLMDQPEVSRLVRGQLSGFSTERLSYILTRVGQDDARGGA